MTVVVLINQNRVCNEEEEGNIIFGKIRFESEVGGSSFVVQPLWSNFACNFVLSELNSWNSTKTLSHENHSRARKLNCIISRMSNDDASSNKSPKHDTCLSNSPSHQKVSHTHHLKHLLQIIHNYLEGIHYVIASECERRRRNV